MIGPYTRGHAVPATIFVSFSLWSLFAICARYFKSKNIKGAEYRNVLLPKISFCQKIPIIGILLIISCLASAVGEMHYGGTHKIYAFHVLIYCSFATVGFVNILYHYKLDIPANLDYAAGCLGMVNEAMLFWYHGHSYPGLDELIHDILAYLSITGIIFLVVESSSNSVLPALGRTYFGFIQGIWLLITGYIVDNWDKDSTEHIICVPQIFGALLIAVFILLLLGFVLISRCQRCKYADQIMYASVDDDIDDVKMNNVLIGSAWVGEGKEQAGKRLITAYSDKPLSTGVV